MGGEHRAGTDERRLVVRRASGNEFWVTVRDGRAAKPQGRKGRKEVEAMRINQQSDARTATSQPTSTEPLRSLRPCGLIGSSSFVASGA